MIGGGKNERGEEDRMHVHADYEVRRCPCVERQLQRPRANVGVSTKVCSSLHANYHGCPWLHVVVSWCCAVSVCRCCTETEFKFRRLYPVLRCFSGRDQAVRLSGPMGSLTVPTPSSAAMLSGVVKFTTGNSDPRHDSKTPPQPSACLLVLCRAGLGCGMDGFQLLGHP